MTSSDRSSLFERLASDVRAAVAESGLGAATDVEVDVFFEDELLFVSATIRGVDGSITWRSSHAATPDSSSLAHLTESGRELVDRITSDARLAQALPSTTKDAP